MTSLRRTLGTADLTFLVIGNVIGSGIFLVPSTILRQTGSVRVALVVWAVAMRAMPHSPEDWEGYYLVAGGLLALGLGMWDDRFGMLPSIKMLGQAAAATLIVAASLSATLSTALAGAPTVYCAPAARLSCASSGPSTAASSITLSVITVLGATPAASVTLPMPAA